MTGVHEGIGASTDFRYSANAGQDLIRSGVVDADVGAARPACVSNVRVVRSGSSHCLAAVVMSGVWCVRGCTAVVVRPAKSRCAVWLTRRASSRAFLPGATPRAWT